MGYIVDTIVEKKSATVRFVGDSPYRSAEDLQLVQMTGPQLQERIRAAARGKGRFAWWWTVFSCRLFRRHVFIDFGVESTATHFVLCARCFKVSRTYREEGTR